MIPKHLLLFGLLAVLVFAALLVVQKIAIHRENDKHRSRTIAAAENTAYTTEVILCVIPCHSVHRTAATICHAIRVAKLPSRLWFVVAQPVRQKAVTGALDRAVAGSDRLALAKNVVRENVRICWLHDETGTASSWLQQCIEAHYNNEQYLLTFEETWTFDECWDERLIEEFKYTTGILRARDPRASFPILVANATPDKSASFFVAHGSRKGVTLSLEPRQKHPLVVLQTLAVDAGDLFSRAESVLRAMSVVNTGTRCMTLELSAGAHAKGIAVVANRYPIAAIGPRARRLPLLHERQTAGKNDAVARWARAWGLQLKTGRVTPRAELGIAADACGPSEEPGPAAEEDILAKAGSLVRYRKYVVAGNGGSPKHVL